MGGHFHIARERKKGPLLQGALIGQYNSAMKIFIVNYLPLQFNPLLRLSCVAAHIPLCDEIFSLKKDTLSFTLISNTLKKKRLTLNTKCVVYAMASREQWI